MIELMGPVRGDWPHTSWTREKTGMLQSHISEMENGTRSIGKIIAKKFAQVFNTDYKVFL